MVELSMITATFSSVKTYFTSTRFKLALLMTGVSIICLIALVIAWPYMVFEFFRNSPRGWYIAKGIDRVWNAVTGGSDEEYFSARAARLREEGRMWACVLCQVLDYIQKGHCDLYTNTVAPVMDDTKIPQL